MNIEPIVVCTEALHPRPEAWLRERCTLVHAAPDSPELRDALRDARGLVIRTYTTVDRVLLDAAPRLEVVARAGVGLDQVDQAACAERGIAVLNTPDANTQAVVEYVFRLLLGAVRPLDRLDHALDGPRWRARRAEQVAQRELASCTLGILGLGRIGRRVATVARSFGMAVQYHDLVAIDDAPDGAHAVDADTLFATSDILTIHIDGRAENRQVVNAQRLESMRPDVMLVNAARGFVLDHAALAAFLRAHPAASAHLDVHDPEPFDDDYPLLACANAFLYPHLAAKTDSAMEAMSWVVRDMMSRLTGVSE